MPETAEPQQVFSGNEFGRMPIAEGDCFRLVLQNGSALKGLRIVERMVERDELYFPAPEMLRLMRAEDEKEAASVTVVIGRHFSRSFWNTQLGSLLLRVERL